MLPVDGEYVPAGQGTHELPAEYCPALHVTVEMQADAPAEEVVPEAQETQLSDVEDPVTEEYVPAPQVVHVVEPMNAVKVPTPHEVQLEAPAAA